MHIIHRQHTKFKIDKVNEKYNSKYMGDWCLKGTDGDWINEPVAVFYVENPDTSLGHTNYFALLTRGGMSMITKGDSAFSTTLYGCIADDGEVVISRFRHDYNTSKDGTVFIDGVRDYSRTYISLGVVEVDVVDGYFYYEGELIEERVL